MPSKIFLRCDIYDFRRSEFAQFITLSNVIIYFDEKVFRCYFGQRLYFTFLDIPLSKYTPASYFSLSLASFAFVDLSESIYETTLIN